MVENTGSVQFVETMWEWGCVGIAMEKWIWKILFY